jgi:hypothetical protein
VEVFGRSGPVVSDSAEIHCVHGPVVSESSGGVVLVCGMKRGICSVASPPTRRSVRRVNLRNLRLAIRDLGITM